MREKTMREMVGIGKFGEARKRKGIKKIRKKF